MNSVNKGGKSRLTEIGILSPRGPRRNFLQLIWVDHIQIYHPRPKTTPPASTGSTYGPSKLGANCSIRDVLVKPRLVALEAAFYGLQFWLFELCEHCNCVLRKSNFVRIGVLCANVTKMAKILQCAAETLLRLHWETTETLMSLFRETPEILLTLHRNTSETLLRLELRLCWDSTETLLRLYWAETLLESTKTLLRLFWDSTEAQLRPYWDYSDYTEILLTDTGNL